MGQGNNGCENMFFSPIAGMLFFSLIGYGVGAILPFVTA